MKIIPIIVISFLVAAGIFSSCKKSVTGPPTDTTHHPCDTCNLNQDSLQRIRDSLAHAFTWQQLTIPQEASLTGCWVFGPNDIYINGTYLWHYDGTTFTRIVLYYVDKPTIQVGLADFNLFAFSKTDFWNVGGGIAFHCIDGKYVTDNRPGGVLNSCWGISSKDMFFVGNGGLIYHYDGIKFDSMISGTTKNLRSVWGTSHNDVWACGFNSSTAETILLHYDGNAWAEDPISRQKGIYATGGFDAVWANDSAGHKFVTTSGAILIRKTDNGLWRSDSGLISNSLGGGNFIGISPSGNNANDFMVIGPWGFISHWNGKTWKQYTQFFDYSNNDYYGAAFSMLGNTACVVGTKSGASWVAIGQRKP